ncbi:MAG: argininosuccinate synthase [Alphaproteobacteria bacterium]|nr:argininosuccinate synthase [Alphaproteobacteria bacterium]
MSDTNSKTAVVAFSGGLDTSMLVPYMRENYNLDKVITCVVDTGSMDTKIQKQVEMRADEVGADEHVYIDASQAFYDEIIKHLIFGNVSRDGYPLSVGSERLIQARETIKFAHERDVKLVANGCTGAGNDQYRFDLVAYVMGNGIESIAPVREHNIKREFSQNFLIERGISVADKTKYSYNAGLWGVSIGGEETHTSDGLIPEEAWYSQVSKDAKAQTIDITFDKGEPVALKTENGETVGALAVIQEIARIGSRMGIGRHYHLGTSIPGKKGRIAYESPAADILYEAHRTLEKHVMTQSQIFFKQSIANEFGKLIHEAGVFDPLIDDLRSYLESSQRRVSGTCKVYLEPYAIKAVTVDSPFDLLGAEGSVYGEYSDFYDARDAEGSSKLHAYEQLLFKQRA